MLDREFPQAVSSYRGELFGFVEDRAKALAERAVSCEDVSKLWNSVKSTARIVWLVYKLGLISDKEAEECCSQMTSSCPMLREQFLEEWQKGFGFIQ